MRKTGFTLVEILVVVGIAGIIIAAAITPLTFSVRTIREAQKNFTANNKERFVINQLFQDAREVIGIQVSAPFKVIHRDGLGDRAGDTLLLWTKTPSYANGPVTCVVYRMSAQSISGSDLPEGLYRWVLSDDKQPDEIEEDDLKGEEGKLVLPGIEGVRFSAMESTEWVDDYAGPCPKALRVTLSREGNDFIYEGWLPQF